MRQDIESDNVNSGSGNGLVPLGKKPLPQSMLTQIYVAIWHHYESIPLIAASLATWGSFQYKATVLPGEEFPWSWDNRVNSSHPNYGIFILEKYLLILKYPHWNRPHLCLSTHNLCVYKHVRN